MKLLLNRASLTKNNEKNLTDFGIIREIFYCFSVIDLIGLLNVVPNSNPLGIKRFVRGISIPFEYECYIIMQIQYTKNLSPGRFELGTTMS